jgi:hypothetical protein
MVCLPAPLPIKLKLLLLASFLPFMLPLCTHTFFLTHRSLNVPDFFFINFYSAVFLAKLSLSLWQLNIDGLEIAEVPEMLSVLRRGQVWPRNTKKQRVGKC